MINFICIFQDKLNKQFTNFAYLINDYLYFIKFSRRSGFVIKKDSMSIEEGINWRLHHTKYYNDVVRVTRFLNSS